VNLHKEISFEDEICGHLAAHGWFQASGWSSTGKIDVRGLGDRELDEECTRHHD
jgi:hypothetical protein